VFNLGFLNIFIKHQTWHAFCFIYLRERVTVKTKHVLLASFVLGVVGLQAVFIAHTHKMITGQPLLLGQDHRSLSHLPPFFFSFLSFFRRFSETGAPSSSSILLNRDLRGGWETATLVPLITLSEHGNYYIVVMEAPGLCSSNIEITLNGRELHLATQSVPAEFKNVESVDKTDTSLYRVRLPGPISETGPPPAEFMTGGRLRVTLRKAEESGGATLDSLTIL
jgi:HSP20 family molecular chaperone IbpA